MRGLEGAARSLHERPPRPRQRKGWGVSSPSAAREPHSLSQRKAPSRGSQRQAGKGHCGSAQQGKLESGPGPRDPGRREGALGSKAAVRAKNSTTGLSSVHGIPLAHRSPPGPPAAVS